MADFLQQLYSALGGMPQQPTQPSGGVGPPAPAASPGIMDILSSPVAQGALSSWLGYLSRPRGINTNRWQGIGLGGLAGLGAYEQARQQQLEMPMRQAELQAKQTELGIEKTKAQQATEQFQQRKQMIDQFDKDPQMQKLDPMQRMVLRNGLLEGKLSLKDLGIEPITPYQKAELDIRRTTAQSEATHRTTEERQRAQQLAQEAAYQRGELGLRGAEVGIARTRLGEEEKLEPLRAKQITASTEASQARTKALGAAGKPLSDKDIESLSESAGKAAISGMKASWTETEKGFEARKNQAYQDAYQQSKQTLRQQRQGVVTGLTAEGDPLSLIPAGASPAIGSDGSHGYVDSTGFHSVEE